MDQRVEKKIGFARKFILETCGILTAHQSELVIMELIYEAGHWALFMRTHHAPEREKVSQIESIRVGYPGSFYVLLF